MYFSMKNYLKSNHNHTAKHTYKYLRIASPANYTRTINKNQLAWKNTVYADSLDSIMLHLS
jgi:hypothetical protein